MIGARIFIMARVCISVVVIALLRSVEVSSVELSAQPAPQGSVNIQATVYCGDVLPGARIEVDPSPSKPGSVQETDRYGQAVLVLPIGVHTLSITFKGLEPWNGQIDVQGGQNPPVDATLSYRGTIVDCVTITSVSADFSLLTPEPVFISLRPLLDLAPLPMRSAKRRW